MILNASAKINLHLDVGPRRKDGYHTLDTIFQEISLHDTLRFSRSRGSIQLTVTPKGLPTNSDNLIVRALEMLRSKLAIQEGIRVHLTKRIPMGAGLGGGSSDAAAALWGGWMMWTGAKRKPKRVPRVLLQCAPKLGADVAFFLRGGIARGRGIGEKLTQMKSGPKRWLVLVYPRVHVATPLAYRLLDESREGNKKNQKSIHPFNSFEPVILRKFPEIAKAKNVLVELGCAYVMMSGSGSTVFGFARDEKHARRVLKAVPHRAGWLTFLCRTLF